MDLIKDILGPNACEVIFKCLPVLKNMKLEMEAKRKTYPDAFQDGKYFGFFSIFNQAWILLFAKSSFNKDVKSVFLAPFEAETVFDYLNIQCFLIALVEYRYFSWSICLVSHLVFMFLEFGSAFKTFLKSFYES